MLQILQLNSKIVTLVSVDKTTQTVLLTINSTQDETLFFHSLFPGLARVSRRKSKIPLSLNSRGIEINFPRRTHQLKIVFQRHRLELLANLILWLAYWRFFCCYNSVTEKKYA